MAKLGRQVIHGHLDRAGLSLHFLQWNPDAEARPAVLLLHGLSSNATFWTRLAGHLGARRLVALDQRAHGASAAPEEGYQPPVLAADAAALVEELQLGPVVVAGHSWGASIALQLAADRPDLVAGLGVIDGPVRAWRETGLSWDQASKFMQPPLPLYRDLEAALAEKRTELKDAWAEDLVEFVRSGLVAEGTGFRLPLTAPIRLQILQAMFFQPYEVLWTQVRCPVLLALADGGPDSGFLDYKRRSAAEVAEQVSGTVVHWYPTGHDIPLERPAEIAAELERLCLRAGFAEVTGEILATDGDWSRPTGYQDWTAKDLLAHLSSTQAALPAVARSRRERGAEPPVKFDSDRWNASQVRRRQELSAAELKAELAAGGQEMDPILAELPVDQVVGAGPFAGETAATAMAYMVDHQREHLAELRRALGS